MTLDGQPFVLGRALLAEMFLELLPTLDFGQMDGGGFGTLVTLHTGTPLQCLPNRQNRISVDGVRQSEV
jgi:hypothetical protein